MGACYGVTQFEFDEQKELESYPLWIYAMHDMPMHTPLYNTYWCECLNHSMQIGAELLSVPTTKGWEWRLVNGRAYLSTILVTEEEERQREPFFREKIRPFIEDFDKEWGKYVSELKALYKPLMEAEPLEKLSNVEFLLHFEDFLRAHKRQWDAHFYVFYIVYPIYALFEQTCRELIGLEPEDPLFKRLMGGFENMLFVVNRGLWDLGDRAKELRLTELFLATEDAEETLRGLDQSEAGKRWLAEYQEFLKVHGWRCERMLEWAMPTWIEQPSLPIPPIRQVIGKGGAFAVDQEREGLVKEREEAEREVLAKVSVDKREWFEKLMKSAQKCGVWSEDHAYYMDMMSSALGRHATKEFGRRFAQAGVIDEPDDVYFLLVPEIEKAAIVMERVNLRPYVRMHREEWESYRQIDAPTFIGDMSVLGLYAQKDPLIRVQANPPMVKPELKADLYGAGSAPGVVEGMARVIISEAELDQVHPGEVLVTPTTFSPWTPIFNIISGVVTDRGGSLCHAVIIAREYRIPAVAGTLDATAKIKTGQRVRVDGDNGAVYVLS